MGLAMSSGTGRSLSYESELYGSTGENGALAAEVGDDGGGPLSPERLGAGCFVERSGRENLRLYDHTIENMVRN